MRKKLLVLLFIVITIISVGGCKGKTKLLVDSNTTPVAVNTPYDELIFEWGVDLIADFENSPNWVYDISKEGDLFVVNVNGDIDLVVPDDENDTNIIIKNEKSLNNDRVLLNLLKRAKEKVCSYIDASNILQHKGTLKHNIEQISIVSADVENEYNHSVICKNRKLYVPSENKISICEWDLVHALIHALADYTNGGMQEYCSSIFDEAMTDIIVCSISPYMSESYVNHYMMYYTNILEYVGIFREEAINAYFYGYNNLYDKYDQIEKTDFDLFVYCFDRYYQNDKNSNMLLSQMVVNNSLLEWWEMTTK